MAMTTIGYAKAALALGTLALLAGCNQPKQPESKVQKVVPLIEQGWTAFFAKPAESIDALNRLGFRVGEYKPEGDRYAATAIPTLASESASPNYLNFDLAGTKDRIDQVRLTLDINDPGSADVAKKQLLQTLNIRLHQLGLANPAPLVSAIALEKPASGSEGGADFQFVVEPIKASEKTRRMILTFTPAGSSPATSQPRNA